ncbi:uncharacterized protein LOC130701312 [Daphnia carinata]|uniref:uncharacterized protein LOC130701312 n=1 Tax=Daphnia carinata TaxID=120202 RepID=UPI0025806C82|nr:uncharacterized protein LOC130701312 [Daphnia carinata]XP_057379268.1 uncharacterized protein LOC130701312 [Daphnia carinata]
MNQRFPIRRLFTMPWLLMALAFLLVATASNRERSGTHQQIVRNNHHHKRNGNSTSRNASVKRSAVQAGTMMKSMSPVADSAPYLASDDVPPKAMISVQTSLNGNIFMHCLVDTSEDFQVSWVRLPDWRIVASGRHIYNKDERFRVLHAEGTGEWTLQIKYAALIDQGLYECQVSTETGIRIFYYNVSVIVPDTSIVGGSEYHVDMGSAIQLTCIIRNIPQEPQFVFWYHNDRMINYDSMADSSSSSKTAMDAASSSSPSSSRTKARARPRVEVVTEIESNLMMNGGEQQEDAADRTVTSQLTIRDVTDADSGNYTCSPSNAEPASTMVYVSEGDDAAAAIQVSVGETTNVSDVVPANSAVSAASSPISTASAATSSVTSSLAVLVFCCLTLANCHIGRR